QTVVFWIVAVFAAVAFGMSHLPAIMYLEGWKTAADVPGAMMAELLLLNGLISLPAAYLFKRFGFIGAAGAHLWADVVWHVVWGLL
ncbi:MAG: hypothetical protein ACM3MF_01750, partial [Anaerolineae bacterium]